MAAQNESSQITVYWKIFALLYFTISQILLSHKIKFHECCHATPFMLPMWIICKNIFRKISEIAIFVKI